MTTSDDHRGPAFLPPSHPSEPDPPPPPLGFEPPTPAAYHAPPLALTRSAQSSAFSLQQRLLGVPAALAFALAMWAVLTIGGDSSIVDTDTTFPTMGAVADAFTEMFNNDESAAGTFNDNVAGSLGRFIASLGAGVALGGLVAVALSWNGWLRSVLQAFASFFRMIPPLAFVSLVILWRGIGDEAIIWTGTLCAAWVFASRAPDALAQQHIAGEGPRVTYMLLGSLRLAVLVAWWSTISLEIIASENGLGAAVFRARNFVRLDLIVAYLIVIGAIGWLADTAIHVAQQNLERPRSIDDIHQETAGLDDQTLQT